MVDLNRELIIAKYGQITDFDYINLSKYNINKIDPNAFKEFTELKYLFLIDNEIEEFEATLCESLSKLEVISFII